MRRQIAVFIVAAIALAGGYHTAAAQNSSHFTIEQMVAITYPSEPEWSPDGRYICYMVDDQGVDNLWLGAADGKSQPRQLTNDPVTASSEPFWDPDSTKVYFSKQGGLWAVGVAAGSTGHPQPAWQGATGSGWTLSPDGKELAYVKSQGGQRRGGAADLMVRNLGTGAERVVVHEDSGGIGAVRWSHDGQHLMFSSGAQSIPHNITFPDIGAKLIFARTENVPGKSYVVAATGGTPVELSISGGGGRGGGAGRTWIDDTHFLSTQTLPEAKGRVISIADISGGAERVIRKDVSDKFYSDNGANANPQVSPDGKWIAFGDENDGWDHIYVMPAAGGAPVKLTPAPGDYWRWSWARHSDRIVFDANTQDHPGDRHLGIIDLNGDPTKASVTWVTSGVGTNYAAQWSYDDRHLVYSHTDPQNSSDLFVIAAAAGAKGHRLTESMPAGLDHSAFVAPQLVHYPGADGKPVPAYLFTPHNLDKSKKHPAIIWIHPDGVNMNYDGWHVNRQESVYYSFHQYLLQEGYVVLAVDYRGSIGYGSKWEEAVYHDVGGEDSKDTQQGAKYLASLGYVDANRIGVWGLSYGGFHTLMDITQQPQMFAAAVDVAGVTDFRFYYADPYNSGWIAQRLGTPEEHPELYEKAAPIEHVDQIQHPLLVLAGTADTNVPFWETVKLIGALLNANKGHLTTFMMYPNEFHYFDHGDVLRDAWHRVDDFFSHNLKPPIPPR